MKKILLFILAAIMILSLSACGNKNAQTIKSDSSQVENDESESKIKNERGSFSGSRPEGMPDISGSRPEGMPEMSGSRPEGMPDKSDNKANYDVVGKVKEIVGNEVTLEIMTKSEETSEYKSSGETETYIIPVGMSIGTGDFTKITTGVTLGLSLNSDGEVTSGRMLQF